MPSMGRPIRFTDDHVCVNIRHFVLERNITGERQDFDLLVDWNLFIFLSFRLEETKNNIIERADRGEMARQHMLLCRKLLKVRDDFIALVKNYGVGLWAALIDQFEFHGSTP